MRRLSLKDKIARFIDQQKHSNTDWYLIGAIFLLVAVGLIIMASAGVALGWQKYQDAYWHLKHQLLYGILPGTFLFLVFYFFDYRKLQKYAAPMLFVSIGLLVLVLIPGIGAEYNGSRAWINIFGITSLQPSELVKLTFLIYLAAWLSQKEGHHLKDVNYGFIPFVMILSVIAGLLILEPDTGTMMIIVTMSLGVYFAAGGNLIHLFWLGTTGFLGLLALINLNPDSYRAKRLTTFLHPELDPRGIGYHINQALLATGSGGWFGRGYGHSRQKFSYLPEPVGDSIFAITAEELGFFLASLIVVIYVFVAVRGFKLASRVDDQFGSLLVVGIIVWLSTQAFVNIGAILGLLPLTGIPLPFISYGGTAMMISLGAVGILANISKQAKG
jgi:cell division protein FtsW